MIGYKLNFEEHLSKVCDKTSQKLKALARISSYIMRAFISSQFGYCPLLWFFCSRKINNRVNRMQERALRIVYKDYVSAFAQLLEKDSLFQFTLEIRKFLQSRFLRQLNQLTAYVEILFFKAAEYKPNDILLNLEHT